MSLEQNFCERTVWLLSSEIYEQTLEQANNEGYSAPVDQAKRQLELALEYFDLGIEIEEAARQLLAEINAYIDEATASYDAGLARRLAARDRFW